MAGLSPDMCRREDGACLAKGWASSPSAACKAVSRHQDHRRQSAQRQNQALREPRCTSLEIGCRRLALQPIGAGCVFPAIEFTHGLDPCAVTAAAHKLARLIYAMLTKGQEYADQGQEYYEERYRQRMLHNLNRRAQQLGMTLVRTAPTALPA